MRSVRVRRERGRSRTTGSCLVGRDAGADAIRALAARRRGDADLRAQGRGRATRCSSRSAATQPLVQDGVAVPAAPTPRSHPRTAIGFKDGGKTLLLVTADGRQAARRSASRCARPRSSWPTSAPRPRSTSTAAARRRWSPAPLGEDTRDAPQRPVRRPASATTRTASACSSRRAAARSDELRRQPGRRRRGVPGPAPHADRPGRRRSPDAGRRRPR